MSRKYCCIEAHMASCIRWESPCLLNYVITDFEVIIDEQQLLPGIVNHIPRFYKKWYYGFSKNLVLIEGTSHRPHVIYRKGIDWFILFIFGNINLILKYLLSVHYVPISLFSNSLKSVWEKYMSTAIQSSKLNVSCGFKQLGWERGG